MNKEIDNNDFTSEEILPNSVERGKILLYVDPCFTMAMSLRY